MIMTDTMAQSGSDEKNRMRTGKVSQAVMDRSVLRPLRQHGAAAQGLRYGSDCGIISAAASRCAATDMQTAAGQCDAPDMQTAAGQFMSPDLVTTAAACTVGGRFDLTAGMLAEELAGRMAAAGASLQALTVTVIVPADGQEEELRKVMDELGGWAARRHVPMAGAHARVSADASAVMLSLTGIGYHYGNAPDATGFGDQSDQTRAVTAPEDQRDQTRAVTAPGDHDHHGRIPNEIRPGQDIVMAGYAGYAGTSVLVRDGRRQLRERFGASFLDQAGSFMSASGAVERMASVGVRCNASAMKIVGEGGVFGALWEMAESANGGAGTGFSLMLRRIPIRQETIEVCEYFGLNPYVLYGQGALLAAVDDGKEFCRAAAEAGIRAEIIGKSTGEKARILVNGDETRYLDRPAQDALETGKLQTGEGCIEISH